MQPEGQIYEKAVLASLKEAPATVLALAERMAVDAPPLRIMVTFCVEQGWLQQNEDGDYCITEAGLVELATPVEPHAETVEEAAPVVETLPAVTTNDDPYGLMAKAVAEETPLPLVALDPSELSAAQIHLQGWCKHRLVEIQEEVSDLRRQYDLAKKRKWSIHGWERQIILADERQVFYRNVMSALEHGYLIIPDLPIQVFAVRVAPTEWVHAEVGNRADVYRTKPLPEGEGQYISSRGKHVSKKEFSIATNQKEWRRYFRTQPVVFPVQLAEVRLIDKTKQAMALRLFDDVGLVQKPVERKPVTPPDPIVIGRIWDPRSPSNDHRKALTFFIGWWFTYDML